MQQNRQDFIFMWLPSWSAAPSGIGRGLRYGKVHIPEDCGSSEDLVRAHNGAHVVHNQVGESYRRPRGLRREPISSTPGVLLNYTFHSAFGSSVRHEHVRHQSNCPESTILTFVIAISHSRPHNCRVYGLSLYAERYLR